MAGPKVMRRLLRAPEEKDFVADVETETDRPEEGFGTAAWAELPK
jgi:hypothetical protein